MLWESMKFSNNIFNLKNLSNLTFCYNLNKYYDFSPNTQLIIYIYGVQNLTRVEQALSLQGQSCHLTNKYCLIISELMNINRHIIKSKKKKKTIYLIHSFFVINERRFV